MFCKDEGPEDEEGSGLVIGIWQWLITEADVMFLRLDWKLARIPCGLNGHWALSWKGEETQRGPHRMATGFVNNHTPQLAPVTAALTTTLDWTVTGNKTGLPDNHQLSGWTEKLERFPKPTLHGNRSWVLSAANLPTTMFWIPGNHYTWEACSANRDGQRGSNPSVSVFPMTISTASPQPVLQKENKLGLMKLATKFCLKTKLTYLSLSNMPTELLAGYILHSQQNAENTFQDFVKLWSIQFCYSNKQIYFLLTKNCTDYNDPYLISLSLVTVA